MIGAFAPPGSIRLGSWRDMSLMTGRDPLQSPMDVSYPAAQLMCPGRNK